MTLQTGVRKAPWGKICRVYPRRQRLHRQDNRSGIGIVKLPNAAREEAEIVPAQDIPLAKALAMALVHKSAACGMGRVARVG